MFASRILVGGGWLVVFLSPHPPLESTILAGGGWLAVFTSPHPPLNNVVNDITMVPKMEFGLAWKTMVIMSRNVHGRSKVYAYSGLIIFDGSSKYLLPQPMTLLF